MRCRPAVSADADTIADFQIAMARETEGLALSPSVCRRGVQAVFDDPMKGRYVVAEEDSRVVASLLLIDEWSDWRNGRVWWIHSVYVVPELRRRGVFSAMYTHVKEQAFAAPDVRGLRLYVERKNTAAQAVYQQLGMTNEHYELYEWMK